MNKTTSLLVAITLGIALAGNAQARDRDDRRHGYDHRPPHYQKFKHHHRHHAPRLVHRHHRDWVGPAALITLGSVAIGAAVSHHLPPAPRVTYYAPPPPSGNWYYCGSSGQYYPYTNACPEGWQAVSPR